MSLYIDCLNKFFKVHGKKKNKLQHNNIRKLNKKYEIAIYNTLGIISNDEFIPSWSIPVDKIHDVVNESLSYKYLLYGISILRDKNMTSNSYFKLYIRYLLTKSNIKLKNHFDLVLLLSIFNLIKKNTNEIVIFKWDKTKMISDKHFDYKIPTISEIFYNEIEFNNPNFYYKIFEIPRKFIKY